MLTLTEEKLTFGFLDDWKVSKFDDWSFYRNQFDKISGALLVCKDPCEGDIRCIKCNNRKVAGTKAIDILAIDPEGCCWLIEIKDYRQNTRQKSIELADEIALKARDTLAALAAARVNANDADEKRLAVSAMRCCRLRIVLHLEQPTKHSKLFPRAIDPAKIKQRLQQLVKAIDPHPLVVEMNNMGNLAWTVN